MKIFISGNPGSGKTTIIKKLIEEFGKENFYGFYTEEIRKNKERIGFKVVTTWGEEDILASIDIKTNYRVGKYFVIKENLDKICEEFLIKFNENKSKIIVIDEIGRMEFYSEKFKEIFNLIMKENINLIATVHRSFLNLVPNYIWLEIGKWWEIYNNIKKEVEHYIYHGKNLG